MYIALREMWRAKLKFGLLGGAVALLVFLLMFLGTLSGTLLSSYVGAIENSNADLLVFSSDARRNVQASRFAPQTIPKVAAIPGVAAASGISETTLTVEIGGERQDLSLWSFTPGEPGEVPVVEGREAGNGEVVMDVSAEDLGFTLGSTVTLIGTGRALEIVGLTTGRQYSVIPTGYTTTGEWNDTFLATYPGVPVVPVSVIAIDVADGADAAQVAADTDAAIADTDTVTPSVAAGSAPGVSSIETSFNLIVGITFGIVVVVIGFFFTILAVQKQKTYALLRAVGSSRIQLATAIAIQIVITVSLGTVLAIGALVLVGTTSGASFPLSIDIGSVAIAAAVVLVCSVASGGFAVRRALRIDPVAAAQGVV